MIKLLYRASQAGVEGSSCWFAASAACGPAFPESAIISRVTSIVGRFLEHSRIFYFRNGAREKRKFISAAPT